MDTSKADVLIEMVGGFTDWENRKQFLAFRAELFEAYDALTEEEQRYVDESMVMEHIAMVYSCYEGIEAAYIRKQNGEKITEEERRAIKKYMK